MQQPELVLVHGAWHGGWAWRQLAEVLEAQGWSSRTVDLPSSGSGADLSADAALVRGVLLETEAPKVLVGHSYGGTVVTQAGAGIDCLVGLVYLCAARPDVGDVVWRDPHSPEEVPDWIKVDDETQSCIAVRGEEILFNDCAADVAEAAKARLKPQSLSSFLEPVKAAAWRERPSAYLICELDRCVPASVQEQLADGCVHIERLAASHSPFLSKPVEVEAFLQRAVASF